MDDWKINNKLTTIPKSQIDFPILLMVHEKYTPFIFLNFHVKKHNLKQMNGEEK